jgi:hypothetical protein
MLLAESCPGIGAVAGTLLSLWLMHTLDVVVLPGAGALNLALEADLSLAAYALLLLIVTGLLCGIVPSWRATKTNVVAAIQTGESHGSTGRLWLRHAFVVGQVAACVILLVLSSLMLRSLFRITSMDPGFDLERGLVASVHLDADRYATDGGLLLGERIVERLSGCGIESASTGISCAGHRRQRHGFRLKRRRTHRQTLERLSTAWSPRYFGTPGVPILRGRDTTRDRQEARRLSLSARRSRTRIFPTRRTLRKTVCDSRMTNRTLNCWNRARPQYQSYGEAATPILCFRTPAPPECPRRCGR